MKETLTNGLSKISNLFQSKKPVQSWSAYFEQVPLSYELATRSSKQLDYSMMRHGTDVNAIDDKGNSALLMAIVSKRHAVVDILLNCGADLDAVNGNGKTATQVASVTRNQHAIEAIERRRIQIMREQQAAKAARATK